MSTHVYPQFGVPLPPSSIPPSLPFSVQYGVTPDNKYIPLQIDESGKLAIGNVTFNGSVSISDITIKGVDPANSNTSQDISVVDWGINGYALRTSIFYQGNPLLINLDGSINVNLLSDGVIPTPINQYATVNATSGVVTIIISYSVPIGHILNISGMIGWGDYIGEFFIKLDGVQKGGGWTSITEPTLILTYNETPIVANSGQVVTIEVNQNSGSTQIMKANLLCSLI